MRDPALGSDRIGAGASPSTVALRRGISRVRARHVSVMRCRWLLLLLSALSDGSSPATSTSCLLREVLGRCWAGMYTQRGIPNPEPSQDSCALRLHAERSICLACAITWEVAGAGRSRLADTVAAADLLACLLVSDRG